MNDYQAIGHRTGRPMTRALEKALDHLDPVFRRQAAIVVAEVAPDYGELAPVFAAISIELQLAGIREDALLSDLDADLADDRHGPG